MAEFIKAYNLTAKSEGGYTNNPKDPGNWTGGKIDVGVLIGTNLGISAPVLQAYYGRIPTVDEMKNLQPLTAQTIYRAHYWNIIRGDEIFSQVEANSIYDSAVNMGAGEAIILAQKALGLPTTGKMDDKTLEKLNNNA